MLDDLDELLSFLQDAETGQRGFLLTGEEHYLEPYRAGLVAIRKDFRELRGLTADNPAHQRRLALLELLVECKLSELQTTIDPRQHEGFEEALASGGDGPPKDERELFLETLERAGGNRTEAARLLRVHWCQFAVATWLVDRRWAL